MRLLVQVCAMWLLASCGAKGTEPPSRDQDALLVVDPIERPTTDGATALANLDGQIESARALLTNQPERTDLVKTLVGMLLTRTQFVGSYEDFDAIDDLTSHESLLGTADGLLVRADYLSAVHRFREAHAALDLAERLGAPRQTERRAGYWLATGEKFDQVLQLRQGALARSETYRTLVDLAAVRAARGEFEEADALFVKALQRYRDVSPLPVAWVSFQRGLMWSESAGRPDRGWRLYAEAVRRLPSYVVANVHLAELELTERDGAEGTTRLRRIEPLTFDPEPAAKLAGALMASEPALAHPFASKARNRYALLLGRHEAAFRDHAAEFYLAAGKDFKRALGLALDNLADRKTPRAYGLALRSAYAVQDCGLVRDLLVGAHAVRTSVNLNELVSELERACD